MTIILPHEGIKINEVEASLNAELLNTILTKPVFERKVHVYIPKFKFEKSEEVIQKKIFFGEYLGFLK
jgi:serine protease inhibitor